MIPSSEGLNIPMINDHNYFFDYSQLFPRKSLVTVIVTVWCSTFHHEVLNKTMAVILT